MFVLFFSAAFAADPAPRCTAEAQAAHPHAQITVSADRAVVVGPTAELGDVFEAIAVVGAEAALEVSANDTGRVALRQVMACLFAARVLTWSAARLHQAAPVLRVKAPGGAVYRDELGRLHLLPDVALVGTGPGQHSAIVFSSPLGVARAVSVEPRTGSRDYLATEASLGQTCAGALEADGWGCVASRHVITSDVDLADPAHLLGE